MKRIYLDHAATSPVHPEVVESMLPYFTENFGNPSSIHFYGRGSRHALDQARLGVADSIGAKINEIIFTSGGSEADNMALIGAAAANREKGNHIITTSIEHHAVLRACESLEKQGFKVTYLPVNENGIISLDDLKNALTDETILVSVMFGNNEIGMIQPIKEISALVHEYGAIFHTDAVQAFGLIEINVRELGIDLMSVSAHKINGPRGVGFLYAHESVKLNPQILGGEQERKRRAGTENVAGIVGLEKAISIMREQRAGKVSEYLEYKKTLIEVFKQADVEFELNGNGAVTLPHILNISFKGTNIESLLVNLDLAGIAVSSGSACTAGSIEPSHVLVAMYGKNSERIRSSIRFSFGLGNTIEEIEQAANKAAEIINKLVKS